MIHFQPVKAFLLAGGLLLCTTLSYGQTDASEYPFDRLYELAYYHDSLGDYEAALSSIQEAYLLAEKENDWENALLYALATEINLHDTYDRIRPYYEAVQRGNRLTKKHYRQIGEYAEYTAYFYASSLAYYYYRRGSYQQAETAYQEILAELTEDDHSGRAETCRQLGLIHKHLGNYELSIDFFLRAQRQAKLDKDDNFSLGFHAFLQKQLADIYALNQQNDQAANLYRTALQAFRDIDTETGRDHYRLIHTYLAYARFKVGTGNAQRGLEVLTAAQSLFSKTDPEWTEYYRDLGDTHAQLGQTQAALAAYRRSLAGSQYDSKNVAAAKTFLSLGKLLAPTDPLRALDQFQEALTNLDDDFTEQSHCENPTEFDQIFSPLVFLDILKQKARVLRTISRDDATYAICAQSTVQLALQTVDRIKVGHQSELEKQTLIAQHFDLFELAIEINLDQGTAAGKEAAFLASEQSKANLLLSAVRNTQIRDYYVPAAVIDAEEQLRHEIRSLREERYEMTRQRKSTTLLDARLGELLREMNAHNRMLQSDYPEYYQLRYDAAPADLANLENGLASDQVIIEYFVGQRQSYAFLLRPEQALEVIEIPISQQVLEEEVQQFLYAIYLPFTEPTDARLKRVKKAFSPEQAARAYAQKGHALYELLFAEIEERIGGTGNKLQIIPAGVLNYLPFDALLRQAVPADLIGTYENKEDYRFLAHDYEISYCYSATLQRLMEAKETPAEQEGILVFHDPDFASQANSIQSVFASLSSFVNVLSEAAHPRSLADLGPLYDYLHFSVHGIIDNERPSRSYLQLRPDASDSLLYLRDIYGLSLPAEMVFTSACNAGVGRLSQGEGILSLARGFAYSGTKSLITTGWEVAGGATDKILTGFYQNLSVGQSKSSSLAMAKRELITGSSYGHPYYWAGILPIGDMRPIDVPNKGYWPWALLLLLVPVGYWLWRRSVQD